MKTANELKRFFKEKLNLKVSARTSSGKQQWQIVTIKSKFENHKYIFESEFPVKLRRLCLEIIYGEKAVSGWNQNGYVAGNVHEHSISMLPNEWEEVMRLWELGVKDLE